MSAQFVLSTAASAVETPKRWLQALPKTRSRSSLPVIATVAVLVVVVAQLLLGVVLANGAYHVEALQTEQAAATRDHTAATQDLVRVQSPQYLVNNAVALGMVANSNTVYLRLSDGAVLGEPSPASGRTLAGSNVANSLLAGVPLVTQLAAQQAAAAQASANATADAHATPNTATGSTTSSPANSQAATTPGTVAGQSTAGSVALPGASIPAVHTR
ncbi:MAG: hypothetical protein ACOYBP_08390 [Microbacteriaceae bacterium]